MAVRFPAALALLLPAIAFAAPVAPDQLRRHIEILASDDFEGRAPGTEGEAKTVRYIAGQFRAVGLEPAGADGGWYQPLVLAVRKPVSQRMRLRGRDSTGEVDPGGLILIGASADERVRDAPLVFAGHGAVLADRGIDQLAGAPLKDAVVLILYDAPDIPGFPGFAERVQAVAERGAAAVIGIVGDDIPWPAVGEYYRAGQLRLDIEPAAPIQGVISQPAAEQLVRAGGGDLAGLLNDVPGPAFTARTLGLRVSLEVATDVRRITTNNVVGRLRGRGGTGQSLLYLGHWDHFGICRPAGEADRICNGAVDNASGIAALIEVARGLAAGRRPKRDILFLATTAEEAGLLGAQYFASRPPVPLASIVAALNLDTVAIAGRGAKVAVIGRGVPALDALIEEAAREQGREIDRDAEADEYVERQDGWALARAGVPSAMVGGAFSDMARLNAFLNGPYHQPGDDLGRPLILGGAAEDADLLIALGRKLADPARYQRP